MKKTALIAGGIAMLLSMHAFAQKSYPVDKGVMMIAGSMSYVSQAGEIRDNERMTLLTVQPSLRYFIIPNFCAGASIFYDRFTYSDNTITTWRIGPILQYYFGGRDTKNYPYVGTGYTYYSFTDSYKQQNVHITGGIAMLIARNVAATLSARYTIESRKPEYLDETLSGNTLSFCLGLATFIY